MIPIRPYRPKAAAPAPAATTPQPDREGHAAHRAIVRHLRTTPAALSAQQVEYLVAFLAMAGEAAAAGGPGDRAVVNALRRETL